jgi:mRNA-degrading endonuclease RelE of RelBE toxin-antitoxin system
MEPRRILLLPSFEAALRDLTPEQREATREALRHFRNRTNENALQVERKSGLKGIWAFRVDGGIRAFFVQGKDEAGKTVSRLFHVGHHDDYRTVKRRKPR